MYTITKVIATNHAIRLSDGTLEMICDDALAKAAEKLNANGGIPLLLDHDWTRPIGWTKRAWVEKHEDHVRLCTESELPETSEERTALSGFFASHCATQHIERTSPYKQLLIALDDDSVKLSHDLCCVYLTDADIASRLIPALQESVDDDGLVKVVSSELVGGGWLKRDGYLICPDSFLRPGWALPNPPNRHLVSALGDVQKRNPSLTVRLAIDYSLTGITESLRDHQQRDYWWGPPFKGDPGSQPYGVTVHGPTKYDCIGDLKQTEFWWYGNDERTVQIEEVYQEPRWVTFRNEPRTPARFVHSIFDRNTGLPCHLDGAVRFYTNEEWSERLEVPIDKFGKRGIRHKLWVVDGEMQLDDWYKLIHMFFKGNFTVAEYFGLGEPTRS